MLCLLLDVLYHTTLDFLLLYVHSKQQVQVQHRQWVLGMIYLYFVNEKTVIISFEHRTITDLFDMHERGNAMGLFLLGPLVGPVVGPIAGGFINECRYLYVVINII
jgi:MFS family permease